MNHSGEIILGLLGSGFFTLLWNRLERIERRMDRLEERMDRMELSIQQLGHAYTKSREG